MNKIIPLEDALRIESEYDILVERISGVCNTLERCLKKNKNRVEELIGKGSAWVLDRGIVYPDEDWSIVDATGTPKVRVGAWDGYDAEPFRNTFIEFPYEWLNMDAETLEATICS